MLFICLLVRQLMMHTEEVASHLDVHSSANDRTDVRSAGDLLAGRFCVISLSLSCRRHKNKMVIYMFLVLDFSRFWFRVQTRVPTCPRVPCVSDRFDPWPNGAARARPLAVLQPQFGALTSSAPPTTLHHFHTDAVAKGNTGTG